MNRTKLALSEEELGLVQNSGWLLTKNSIIEKVYHLFGEIASQIRPMWMPLSKRLPAEISEKSPKISRGEKYHGLPYVMLDYPRFFNQEDIFAVRTMFWWGHFFSTTLHLKGAHKKRVGKAILSRLESLRNLEFHIAISKDEWDHTFDNNNYISLANLKHDEVMGVLLHSSFIKLSGKVALIEWNEAMPRLIQFYKTIFELVNVSYPGDERDLLPGNPKAGFDL